MIKCREIAAFIEEIAPKYLAEDWDNVGMMLGDCEKVVKHILVCLDITSPIVDYAESINADMIISHHPLIFRPIRNICMDDWKSKLISRLIKKDICVYCAHTNLDYAEEGVNWHLAQAIGLVEVENFETKKMKEKEHGFGKMGILSPPHDLVKFIDNLKNALKTKNIKLIGNIDKKISRVAVFSGSFNESILSKLTNSSDNIDVFITGDIKHHTAIEICEMGMCAIDAGHFATENVIVPQIIGWLKKSFQGIKISCNPMEKGPFEYI